MTIVFTDYGINVANNETPTPNIIRPNDWDSFTIRGMLQGWNTGCRILLTGDNGYQRTVQSVIAAFAWAELEPRIRHAWLLPSNEPPPWAPTRGRALLFRQHQ